MIEANDAQGIRKLLDDGLDVNTDLEIDEDTWMSIEYASILNAEDAVEVLLGAGCGTENDALLYAAQTNDPILLGRLVDVGFDPLCTDEQHAGLLHFAVQFNAEVSLGFALDHGCAIDTQDQFGDTPLAAAVQNKNSGLAKRLLEAGADPNCQTDGPMLLTASAQSDLPMCKLLIAYGANVNAADNSGMTPYLMAKETCEYNIMNLLLDNGAEQNPRIKSGNGTSVAKAAFNTAMGIEAKPGYELESTLKRSAYGVLKQRVKACLFDMFALSFIMAIGLSIIQLLLKFEEISTLLVYGLFMCLYALMGRESSIGMRMMDIKAYRIKDDGAPNFLQAMIRGFGNLMLPIEFLVGLFSKSHRTLSDLIGATAVEYNKAELWFEREKRERMRMNAGQGEESRISERRN